MFRGQMPRSLGTKNFFRTSSSKLDRFTSNQ